MAITGDATHTKIAEAVVQRIQDLDLEGISDADIQLRVFDEDLTKCFPGFDEGKPGVAVLAIGFEEVTQREGENIRDWIGYPIVTLIAEKCEEPIEQVGEIDRRLKWRQDIRTALWHKPVELVAAGAPDTVSEISWQPGQIFLPKLWAERNSWVGTMLFRVWSCELRT